MAGRALPEPRVRPVAPKDAKVWLGLRRALWPDGSISEHQREIDSFLTGRAAEPKAVLVAERPEGVVLGFVELSIRSYAEGCRTDRVAYLEGWFVLPEERCRGVGGALLKASEEWARCQGCTEFASDAQSDNELSAMVHRSLGFTDAGLVRCFRKDL